MPTSTRPRLVAIAAMASNRVIGKGGELPWHLPDDLKFFKRTTLGHAVLMGRRTFESVLARLGRPLPGRVNIVLSKSMAPCEGVTVIRDLAELSEMSRPAENGARPAVPSGPVFLIGGAELFDTLLPRCDELLLTFIERPHEGDVFFPAFEDAFELREILGGGPGFEFRRYVRRSR